MKTITNLIKLNFFNVLLVLSVASYSQTTVTIYTNPSNCEDAELRSDNPNDNYGSNPNFIANAWSAGGNSFIERSVMNIDLSSIPANANIIQATLSLYCNITSGHSQLHSTLSGSNGCWLSRITGSWNESTVTWNNQPPTTSVNQVSIPISSSQTQDYPNIDVTNLLQDIVNNPLNSYGFMISLKTE